MHVQKQNIICLMGPTASGKTDLALQICNQFSCEIISVDSALIYKEMNIGTAKPSNEILNRYPHHLINIISANESYSVAQFLRDTMKLIPQILQKGKIPLLVGGTMMYFYALQKGFDELPPSNTIIRNKILKEAELHGWEALHERLSKIDRESAARIHPNDPQRLVRALEVYELSNRPMSSFYAKQNSPLQDFNIINIAISPHDRAILHKRIEQRYYQMLDLGFVEEVRHLYHQENMSINLPSMRSVGYRQVWEYLADEISYEDMIKKSIAATRQLAKRQLTWLRRWEHLTWFDSGSPNLQNEVIHFIKNNLK